MAVAPVAPKPVSPPDRRRPRWGLLAVAIGLPAVLVLAANYVPLDEVFDGLRGMVTFASVLLGCLLVAVWLVFFSGMRRVTALLLVLVAAALPATLLKTRGVTGSIVPVLEWRFAADHGEAVRVERAAQQEAGVRADLSKVQPGDSPAYRGEKRDGTVTVRGMTRDWQNRPPKQLWKQSVGEGYAAFAAVNGFAVTIEQRGTDEAVACYEVATGKQVWAHEYQTRFDEAMGGPGPRATPTIADGDVYSLGATGVLKRLDGGTGRPKWEKNILEGNANISWAMSGSPLVYDDVVVVNPGAQKAEAKGKALVAYDRATGAVRWQVGDHRAGYASPMLATVGGVRQVVIFDGHGLAGYDAAGTAELWRYPWQTQGSEGINCAQPVVLPDDRVLIASGYNTGAALLKVAKSGDGWKVDPVWRSKTTVMRCQFASPAVVGNFVYGLDDSIFQCLDLANGKSKWKDGRYGHGQHLTVIDPDVPESDPARVTILVLTETGQLALVRPDPAGHKELGKLSALSGPRTWNNPCIAGTKLLVRNDREMACYELTP